MRLIDLRSDTVTHPTKSMRSAMADAIVGDDVWGDDPTVNSLQELAADLMGKESALFVASGTMANLVSILTHCQRGDEIITGNESHIFYNEVGAAAAVAGVQVNTVANDSHGMMDPSNIEAAIRSDNIHFPTTGLVCIENTHNRCNGGVLTKKDISEISHISHSYEIPVHMDGARIFNASVYLKIEPKDLTGDVDSVSFCLSKGLSCPIGSLLCGSRNFIDRARKARKMIGGGMRQAGIIAAAGIIGIKTMIGRLEEDHVNAKKLANGLANIPGICIDPININTNIVIFTLANGGALNILKHLANAGVLGSFNDSNRIRMVTHYGINSEDIDLALKITMQVMKQTEL